MRRILEIMLQDLGHAVLCAGDGAAALNLLDVNSVDLIITDMRMPRLDGIGLLKTLHERRQLIPTIMITAHGSVDSAVAAMKYGAVDYIQRPFDMETVELAVTRALGVGQVQRENRFLRDVADEGWQEFIGNSQPMRALYELIEKIGVSRAAAFIIGETGTGKELVARALHKQSGRAGLFVPINCAAIPESILESELFGHVKGAFTGAHAERIGKFEMADGGTLFLDEITEMPVPLQAKLLRVLQENCIERVGSNRRIELDARIIAATNRDPARAVSEGKLREDLLYRLNVLRIDVPPLRERRDDIPLLLRHMAEKRARAMGEAPPAIESEDLNTLLDYRWPGNVREMENVVERALVLSGADDFTEHLLREVGGVRSPTASGEIALTEGDLSMQPRIEALERQLIRAALQRADDNKAKTARLLDISERSLWYKLKKYGLS